MTTTTHEDLTPIVSKYAKLTDQIINDPNIFVEDFPLDPFTPIIKTNNFLQQVMSRNLGYDDVEKNWTRLIANKYSYLVTGVKTIDLHSFDDLTVPVMTPHGVFLKNIEYEEITIFCKCDGIGFVWVAGSETGLIDDYAYVGSMNLSGSELGKCLIIRQQFKYLQISWNSCNAPQIWSGWVRSR